MCERCCKYKCVTKSKKKRFCIDTEEIDIRITIQSSWAITGDRHGQIVQRNDNSVLTRNARLKLL